jgi:hypothetical protein
MSVIRIIENSLLWSVLFSRMGWTLKTEFNEPKIEGYENFLKNHRGFTRAWTAKRL